MHTRCILMYVRVYVCARVYLFSKFLLAPTSVFKCKIMVAFALTFMFVFMFETHIHTPIHVSILHLYLHAHSYVKQHICLCIMSYVNISYLM